MNGPGTILHQYLESLGIKQIKDCNCSSHQETMDKWGPDECNRRIKTIVGWLREEAVKRKLPFCTLAAYTLIKWVIHQSKKNLQNSENVLDSKSNPS